MRSPSNGGSPVADPFLANPNIKSMIWGYPPWLQKLNKGTENHQKYRKITEHH